MRREGQLQQAGAAFRSSLPSRAWQCTGSPAVAVAELCCRHPLRLDLAAWQRRRRCRRWRMCCTPPTAPSTARSSCRLPPRRAQAMAAAVAACGCGPQQWCTTCDSAWTASRLPTCWRCQTAWPGASPETNLRPTAPPAGASLGPAVCPGGACRAAGGRHCASAQVCCALQIVHGCSVMPGD